MAKRSKVGHCGTLDPLATGVLIVCVGPATRLAQLVQDAPKTYIAGFQLGLSSDTEDCLGDVQALENAPTIQQHQLAVVVAAERLAKLGQHDAVELEALGRRWLDHGDLMVEFDATARVADVEALMLVSEVKNDGSLPL